MVNGIGSGLSAYLTTNSLLPANSLHQNNQEGSSKALSRFGDSVQISQEAIDLHNGQLPGGMFLDPYSFVTAFGESDVGPDNGLQLSKDQQARVDALNKELDAIFGVPKEALNKSEQAQEKKLVDAIDKVLQKTEPEPLTKAQERQFESISKEIDKLFADGRLTADEEKKLKAFEARIDKLFEGQEPKQLSGTDQKELDKLFQQLDTLYGIKQPNKEQIARSEEIFAELDGIYETAAKKSAGSSSFFDGLTAQHQDKLNGVLNSIEQIFTGTTEPALSDADQKKVEAINKQINAILGISELSDEQSKKVEKIDRKIMAIYEDGKVTPEEEKTLNKLDKQLDDIFGKPKELSEADQKKLDGLYVQLDTIFAKHEQPLNDLLFDRLLTLSNQLDEFWTS